MDPAAQADQRRLGRGVRQLAGLHQQKAVDDLQVVLHPVIDLAQQEVALLKRLGALLDHLGQPGIGDGQRRRPFGHARLQQGVGRPHLGLALAQQLHGPVVFGDRGLQLGVQPFEVGDRRQRQHLGHQRPEDDRGGDGEHRRGRLDQPLDPVGRHPQGQDRHQMGGAACHDERDEQIGDPAVLDVRPAADEHRQRQRNGEIGQADHHVGDHVQGDQARRPAQAEPMRRKAGWVEQPIRNRHDRLSPG